MSFAGVIISIYLFRFAVLSCMWMVTIPVLRHVIYWAIRYLPHREKRVARKELEMFLRVAQWGGVASYAIWTISDVAQLAASNELLFLR